MCVCVCADEEEEKWIGKREEPEPVCVFEGVHLQKLMREGVREARPRTAFLPSTYLSF